MKMFFLKIYRTSREIKRGIFQIPKRIFHNPYTIWITYLVKNKFKSRFLSLYNGVILNKLGQKDLIIYNFRRNIHRLEKGLINPFPKKVFALDYILETVIYLEKDLEVNLFDLNTRSWGIAVLDSYFKLCDHKRAIFKAYQLYSSLNIKTVKQEMVPYSQENRPSLSVDFESFYQFSLRRRSIRSFTEDLVDEKIILKAMKIARLSPSGCNRQSFFFLFYNKPEIVNKIIKIPAGIKGYKIPSLVLVIGKYGGYSSEGDLNSPIIDASLATMSFIYALETLGLSSVCINWATDSKNDKKIRSIIQLKEDEFVILAIGVGYPLKGALIPYSAKIEVDRLVLINERLRG